MDEQQQQPLRYAASIRGMLSLSEMCDQKEREAVRERLVLAERLRGCRLGRTLTLVNKQSLEIRLLEAVVERLRLQQEKEENVESRNEHSQLCSSSGQGTQVTEVAVTPRSSSKENSEFDTHEHDTPGITSKNASLESRSLAMETLVEESPIEVFVKWESVPGDLIGVVKIAKTASLADLKKEISPNVPYLKQEFQFLMLGDDGAPVDTSLEPSLRVLSLPSCKNNAGSRLAVLRPPLTRRFQKQPTMFPFKPLGCSREDDVNRKQQSKHSTKSVKRVDTTRFLSRRELILRMSRV